jgi:hypothetical protein
MENSLIWIRWGQVIRSVDTDCLSLKQPCLFTRNHKYMMSQKYSTSHWKFFIFFKTHHIIGYAYKCQSKEYFFINSIIIVSLLLLFLLLNFSLFYTFYKEALAFSPPFGLQEITNENRRWILTYGNSDTQLI